VRMVRNCGGFRELAKAADRAKKALFSADFSTAGGSPQATLALAARFSGTGLAAGSGREDQERRRRGEAERPPSAAFALGVAAFAALKESRKESPYEGFGGHPTRFGWVACHPKRP